MDAVRYYIALLTVVAFPAAMSMWFVIHPLAGFWRKRGPILTYLVVASVALSIGFAAFRFRDFVLGVEFGFGWENAILAIACYAGGIALEVRYRRQISIGMLFGLPEVSDDHEDVLLDQGIYSRIRHPRYLGLLCEITGSAFLVNYLATYLLVAATVPALYLIVLMEERELVQRFGSDYVEYASRVPRFLPGRKR